MNSKMLFQGYDESFFINQAIPLPKLNEIQSNDLVITEDGNNVIKYINYSLQLSASHKFPFFTATNIDGLQFKKVPRKDNWRKDDRIPKNLQWGKELYTAPKGNFDRGHMTKREDVQWGETIEIALNAADSTFFYTNAVPQHKDLNRYIWRSLEDYILHTETKKNSLKISVFTGPVLSYNNPYFVNQIKNVSIQLPILFWKVVIFPKDDGKLYRVGFMMCQNSLLEKHGIIEELESGSIDETLFMQFKDADTYQVNISLIEELSGLIIPSAIDSYTDSRNTKLILNEVDIDPDLESDSIEQNLGFSIKNIIL
jgi:endonuclease G